MIPVRLKFWAVLVDEKPTPCVSCGREMPAGEEVYCERFGLYRKNPTHESLETRLEALLVKAALGDRELFLFEECQAPYRTPYHWLTTNLGLNPKPKFRPRLKLVRPA